MTECGLVHNSPIGFRNPNIGPQNEIEDELQTSSAPQKGLANRVALWPSVDWFRNTRCETYMLTCGLPFQSIERGIVWKPSGSRDPALIGGV